MAAGKVSIFDSVSEFREFNISNNNKENNNEENNNEENNNKENNNEENNNKENNNEEDNHSVFLEIAHNNDFKAHTEDN